MNNKSFVGAPDSSSCSLCVLSPGFYIPVKDYSINTPIHTERNKIMVWSNNWDDRPGRRYLRSLTIRREYFYYDNDVECRGTLKRAFLKGLANRVTFPKNMSTFTFIVTNDLQEIDNVYSNKCSELIIRESSIEAINQYNRLIKVLLWLNQKLPMYLQRNKNWDIMGPPLLEYVTNVATPLGMLESAFQQR